MSGKAIGFLLTLFTASSASRTRKPGTRRSRMLVALALAALAPTVIVAVVPTIAPTPVLVPVNINVSAGDQFDPHVSGDWVAYTSDLGIRYYNFATNVDAAIPLGSTVND